MQDLVKLLCSMAWVAGHYSLLPLLPGPLAKRVFGALGSPPKELPDRGNLRRRGGLPNKMHTQLLFPFIALSHSVLQ